MFIVKILITYCSTQLVCRTNNRCKMLRKFRLRMSPITVSLFISIPKCIKMKPSISESLLINVRIFFSFIISLRKDTYDLPMVTKTTFWNLKRLNIYLLYLFSCFKKLHFLMYRMRHRCWYGIRLDASRISYVFMHVWHTWYKSLLNYHRQNILYGVKVYFFHLGMWFRLFVSRR